MLVDETFVQTVINIEKDQLRRRKELDREEDTIRECTLQYLTLNTEYHVIPTYTQAEQDQAFICTQTKPWTTLADIVFSKKETIAIKGRPVLPIADRKVAQVYKKMGQSLAHFTTVDTLPKAIKIIPSLSNWDAVLFLTCPSNWSSEAVLQITLLFLNHIKAIQTKQYFEYVLVHAIKSNLIQHNYVRLDSALYQCLQKAILSHPGIFFKGYLFPQSELGCLSLAEAMILRDMMTGIPVVYTTMALLQFSTCSITLPVSLLMDALVNQRQPLPYRVIDALVYHYFNQSTVVPCIWYQTLDTFISVYHTDMVPIHKKKLLDTIHNQQCLDHISHAYLIQNIKDEFINI
ncbi:snoRNA-binding rRNA-processing protein [Rhizopus stolonifer]|uniref:SnoRNA-binding rRNA-processing protein n=1 Tax=Rhizopus stolonifer TaxID=4846 RepID=A0A367IMK0_RHIST|nr:snoRNA-binding rRNA-processing protein [Rhizopus stolonifer]